MTIAWDGGAGYFLKFVVGMVGLYGLAFVVGLHVRAFMSRRRPEAVLRGGLLGNVTAAGFGALTPFCSCTTVPIFSAMLDSDVRLGHAMSFLIASPTLNPPAVILLLIVFGWPTTLAYVAAVFVVAILGGLALGGRGLEGYVYELLIFDTALPRPALRDVLRAYLQFLRGFILIILVAGGIATALKGWAPPEAILQLFAGDRYWAVPLLVGAGILLYADVVLLIPIAASLVDKGLPDGSVLAFTMAASGLGLPTLVLLSKVASPRLIGLYVGVVAILLVVAGYAFNLFAS